MLFGLVLGLWLGATSAWVSAAEKARDKKLIEVGWDAPDTQFLKEHWREMERSAPFFDGVVFLLDPPIADTDPDRSAFVRGRNHLLPWQAKRLKREWFEQPIENLRTCAFEKFTDNFIWVTTTPGNVDWFDAQGWEGVAHNLGVLAAVAKKGGAKGLCLDAEAYDGKQFAWNPAKGRTFADTCEAARERGRGVMRAIAREYPDITILAFWLFSANLNAVKSGNVEEALKIHDNGLYSAFVNGMLDAAPPTVRLVDATEDGYLFDGREDYLQEYWSLRGKSAPALRLVEPENRAKYLAQTSIGYGLYLDSYLNPPESTYYLGGEATSRLAALRENFGHALDVADEYVWAYGEQCRWWSIEYEEWALKSVRSLTGKGRFWEEAMPGISRTLQWVRDPKKMTGKLIGEKLRRNKLVNLVPAPGFEDAPTDESAKGLPSDWKAQGMPPNVFAWQGPGSAGTFTWDKTVGDNSHASIRAAGVSWGSLIMPCKVTPGRRYVVRGECRNQGSGTPSLVVRWQGESKQWVVQTKDVTLMFEKGDGEWDRALGIVTVPKPARFLIVLPAVRNQATANDVCWFDNVEVYELDNLLREE